MRIAFYAPMKAPDDATPSGDRRIGRLLLRALELAGHDVTIASRLRSWDGCVDRSFQTNIEHQAKSEQDRLLQKWDHCTGGPHPHVWFTYHLYYKAPDLIGPAIARRLNIPYVVAEASLANKRRQGPWAKWHETLLPALTQAARVIALNPEDAQCLPEPEKITFLKPFVDTTPYRTTAGDKARYRQELAQELELPADAIWLLAVGMMRPGDKLDSYRCLAKALETLGQDNWRLLICGDGPAKNEVRAAFQDLPADRLRYLGALPEEDLPPVYAACDVMVWPGIKEAYGMALLEAQASGLPVVSADRAGIATIVQNGITGILCPEADSQAFGQAVDEMLRQPEQRKVMGQAALEKAGKEHDITTAAEALSRILRCIHHPVPVLTKA